MNSRILFLTCNRKKDIYGITSGLFNSATFVVNYLNTQGFEAKLVPVVGSNSVDREVTKFNPAVVVVEAFWIPPSKFRELLNIKRHQDRRWIVRVHSKAPFLAQLHQMLIQLMIFQQVLQDVELKVQMFGTQL